MNILQARFAKMGPLVNHNSGKVNFTNLSHYSKLSEKTDRRHYRQPVDFVLPS